MKATTLLRVAPGWTMSNTGGGCTALVYVAGSFTAYMTAEQDPSAPTRVREPVRVGIYREGDSEPLATGLFPSVVAAVAGVPEMLELAQSLPTSLGGGTDR